MASTDTFQLRPIGVVRSTLAARKDAPRQGYLGAPDAWIEVAPEYADALDRIDGEQELILITWFHASARDVLRVHPKWNPELPLTGVFATRSPDRPNPLGLHRVRLLGVDGNRLHVEPLEAIDGTPVVDIKPVLRRSDER